MTSTPRLRVLMGTSPSTLSDVSRLVNTDRAYKLQSAHFEGSLIVHIKGFPDAPASEYFEREERRGVTWSIQVQGRFLTAHSADDILFGNTFDRPLKLPWGSGAALKFMHFIDPTLEHDLCGPKPWALSPLISTMPYFAHARGSDVPPFPSLTATSLSDDTPQLFQCRQVVRNRAASTEDDRTSVRSASSLSTSSTGNTKRNTRRSDKRDLPRFETASKRRAYFRDAVHRRQITFGPDDVVTTDFCYGFISFPSLALNLPGGISFDLKKYWDGQPVRFVCVERTPAGVDIDEATMFWCVVFEAADD